MKGLKTLSALIAGLEVVSCEVSTPAALDGHRESLAHSHIFNAIHSALRKWDSSVNAGGNGMSAFLTTVPEGTLLYHGNPRPEVVNGTEFLAFDPEFSLVFARKRRGPGAGRGGHGPGNGQQQQKVMQPHFDPSGVRGDEDEGEDDGLAGWLHTYKTRRDLNLLYIDGHSAAKGQSGTLDFGDRVVLNDTTSGGFEGEYLRAETFCKFSKDHWQQRVDGLMRLGGDFEMILCSFEEGLDFVRRVRTKTSGDGGRGRGGPPPGHGPGRGRGPRGSDRSRAGGIGIRSARANFDDFVSAYAYGLDLFNHEGEGQRHVPRLTHVPSQELEPVRYDIEKLILNHTPSDARHDWQTIVDMTIARYADKLASLADPGDHAADKSREVAQGLLTPFIDWEARSGEAEIERCATEYLPTTATNESLAYRAVYGVTRHICATLVDAVSDDGASAASTAELFQRLVRYLNWPVWKKE